MTINIPNRKGTAILKELLQAGLTAADPVVAIEKKCKVKEGILWVERRRYALKKYGRIVCVGAGKASSSMAMGVQQLIGKSLEGGLVIVKDIPKQSLENIAVYQAGHPIPNSRSLQAAKRLQQFIHSLTSKDLLIVLISGGTSSLVASPAFDLTLKDKERTTNLLLRSSATIQEINTVRKHLSLLKGGQLVTSTSATIIGLILSDVIGDDLSTIGSGLTAPDPTTFGQAHQILESYNLWSKVPASIKRHVQEGMRGVVSETLKPEDPRLKRVHNVIIGSNNLALTHVAKAAKAMGLHPYVQNAGLKGEAKEIGRRIATIAKDIDMKTRSVRRPACLIWGGEPTVTVTGNGKGGRAQECALSAAIGMAGLPNMLMAGCGTDGSDGPTDVTGAVVDGRTVIRAKEKGLHAAKFLRVHDSYSFFKQAGGHIKTGPTGTNVNDIYLLLAL